MTQASPELNLKADTGILSVGAKRRLRRERMSATKIGEVVPYVPVSTPVSSDAPKLTNHAKRAARLRKKCALELETNGFIPIDLLEKKMKKRKKDEEKKKKKIKVIKGKLRIEAEKKPPNQIINKTKGGAVHIKFGDEDELLEDSAEPLQKSSNKRKKLIEDTKEDCKEEEDADTSSLRDEGLDSKKCKKPKFEEEENKYILFVGNIPWNATHEDIRDHFGDTKNVHLRGGGFCHVEFNDEQSYLKALEKHQTILNKRKINVERMKTKATKVEDQEDVKDTKKDKSNKPAKKMRFVLFVGNLAYNTSRENVLAHFSKVGEIVDVRLGQHVDEVTNDVCSKGFCHVEVKDEETYLKALSLNQTFMGQRRINVEYSGCQTKSTKAEQKKKKMKIKMLQKSGNMFEIRNPTHSQPAFNKTQRQTKVKVLSQEQRNKVWV